MKLLCFIGAILFLALTACHRPVETCHGASLTSELVSIDSLMQTRPDSALVLLQASPKEDPYYQLLLSEALYKNDSAQLNRPELLEAMAHYDSLGCPFLSARCHYMNGVGYYEMDSVVQACQEYLKALEIMEGHFKEKDLVGHKAKFMALINNRLGNLFSEQFIMETAIICLENSLVFSRIMPISVYSVANANYHIGKQYHKLGQLDSANYYYMQALENMPDTQNLFYRDMVSTQAILDYQRTHLANPSVQRLRQVLNQTDDWEEKLTRYLSLGDIFFEAGEYDSSMLYLKDVFNNRQDEVSRIQAAEYLRIIYDSLGEQNQLEECIRFLAEHKKSNGQGKSQVSQLQDLFHNYLVQKQQIIVNQEKKAIVLKVVFVIVPVAFGVCIFLLIMVRRNKKRLENQRLVFQMENAALSGKLRKRNQMLQELRDKDLQQKNALSQHIEHKASSFAEEPICRLIMKRVNEGRFKSQMDYAVYKEYAIDREQLLALREAADFHFNKFTIRLKKAYPQLTKGDLDYCCLYLLNLTDADISALMQRAYNTVNERNHKIRKILGVENNLYLKIQAIAKSN